MKIGIMGIGYVGLPLAVAFAEEGHDVVGVDVDPRKVEALNVASPTSRTSPRRAFGRGGAHRGHDPLPPSSPRCDAIIVCVPTPLSANREPDLGPLVTAGRIVADLLQRGQLVVLESTTYPGTTRERLAPILEESGLAAGSDFHVAFSPERVDPGRTDYTMRNTPKVVGGLTEACGDRAEALYRRGVRRDRSRLHPRRAELTKLLENIFRSVNIALVNELAMLTDRMGIDIWEVIDAAATKPYGFMRFEPGPGLGGHCLPVDPFYLSLARAGVRPDHRVHRVGGQDQPADALSLRGEGRARAQRARASRCGQPDRGPRRELQGRRRGRPRVAGAEDHRAAQGARRRARLPRSRTCRPCLTPTSSAWASTRRSRAATSRSSRPLTQASTTTRSPSERRSSWTSGA